MAAARARASLATAGIAPTAGSPRAVKRWPTDSGAGSPPPGPDARDATDREAAADGCGRDRAVAAGTPGSCRPDSPATESGSTSAPASSSLGAAATVAVAARAIDASSCESTAAVAAAAAADRVRVAITASGAVVTSTFGRALETDLTSERGPACGRAAEGCGRAASAPPASLAATLAGTATAATAAAGSLTRADSLRASCVGVSAPACIAVTSLGRPIPAAGIAAAADSVPGLPPSGRETRDATDREAAAVVCGRARAAAEAAGTPGSCRPDSPATESGLTSSLASSPGDPAASVAVAARASDAISGELTTLAAAADRVRVAATGSGAVVASTLGREVETDLAAEFAADCGRLAAGCGRGGSAPAATAEAAGSGTLTAAAASAVSLRRADSLRASFVGVSAEAFGVVTSLGRSIAAADSGLGSPPLGLETRGATDREAVAFGCGRARAAAAAAGGLGSCRPDSPVAESGLTSAVGPSPSGPAAPVAVAARASDASPGESTAAVAAGDRVRVVATGSGAVAGSTLGRAAATDFTTERGAAWGRLTVGCGSAGWASLAAVEVTLSGTATAALASADSLPRSDSFRESFVGVSTAAFGAAAARDSSIATGAANGSAWAAFGETTRSAGVGRSRESSRAAGFSTATSSGDSCTGRGRSSFVTTSSKSEADCFAFASGLARSSFLSTPGISSRSVYTAITKMRSRCTSRLRSPANTSPRRRRSPSRPLMAPPATGPCSP